MTEVAQAAQLIIAIDTPRRVFKGHESDITAVEVFPDRRRVVTGSDDTTLRLWDLEPEDGAVLKKMEGHSSLVHAVAISGDGKLIASGDDNGEFIVWDGDTGESITQAIKGHSRKISSLAFSPNNAELATVSWDKMIRLWKTDTWEIQGNPMDTGRVIQCGRYSPDGNLLAITTVESMQIWNPSTSECVAKLGFSIPTFSLAWTPDSTRLFSGGHRPDSTIRVWDVSTWEQVGDPWSGHTSTISALAFNSSGTLVATTSTDGRVRLWRLSDRRTIAIFKHSHSLFCVTFSKDGKYILTGGADVKLSEWAIPEDAFLEDTIKEQESDETLLRNALDEPWMNNNAPDFHSKILSISTAVRNACVTSNLTTAEEFLTRQINVDGSDHLAYANRSFVLARKCEWDNALLDAHESLSIQPSLIGYISEGISLCGKTEIEEAMQAFDLASMFTAGDPNATHLLLLVKAVALFNANRHEQAMLLITKLASACPEADILACHIVEAYLRIQLGINALNDSHHNEAVDHFAAAINTAIASYEYVIHGQYEIFVILFGWDFLSSWQAANQGRCHALLQASRLAESHKAYRRMMDMSSDARKASCLAWSTAFKQECRDLYAADGITDLMASGDAALAASNYDIAIELYSAEIDLDCAVDTIFAKRCKAKMGKTLWEEALLDAQKVIEVNPSSHIGYHLKNAVLHGAQRYDEAIEVLEFMYTKLDDPDTPALRRQYISPSEAQCTIQDVIDAQMENAPTRLFNTFTGRLCDQDAVINSFKASKEYKELLSSIVRYASRRLERIQEVVGVFFQYVMLSHRWEGREPLLHDVHLKNVYELKKVDGILKLQSFCEVARDLGYRWAWSDTCCIDKNNNVDLQKSVNSMFIWYRHSALTIVYLSDVSPSSKSGALAQSAWNGRGWTVQEFLAPRVVLFYQKDWTLYLDDHSPNHKESAVIMQELGDATGINTQALIAFRPEMRGAREKLRWSSKRVTTLPEDIAYSLFGTFGVHLPPIYGERRQNALGRLLQEIVAQSGDISCLDWIGKSSEFNSFLPANIISYAAPPFVLPSLSNNEMEISIFRLQNAGAVESASQLCAKLNQQVAARFAHRRLHLPCIIFTVTNVVPSPSPGQEQETGFTYAVKVNGLHDLLISTEDKIPIRQGLLLVRPWDRNILELHNLSTKSSDLDSEEDYQTPPSSPIDDSSDTHAEHLPVDSEHDLRALQLVVRLGQPFRAFLLKQQRGAEYKRIAADHDIVAHVKDMASVCDMVDVKVLEIL